MKAFYTILLLIVSNYFIDVCLVWASEATRDKVISNWPLYAVVLFSWVIALAEVFLPGSGQSDRLFRQWRPVLIDATQSDSGSNHFDYSFTVFTTVLFKGETLHWNHFAAFVLSGTGGIFCIL